MTESALVREVELKAVVDDPDGCYRNLEMAGGRLVFVGRLEDRRYDTPTRTLAAADIVLRLRIYRDRADTPGTDTLDRGHPRVTAQLDWKGATERLGGFKVRDELSTSVSDPNTMAVILTQLGYAVTREIDREIVQYTLGDTVVRFERYPRMDLLVEVEGPPAGIETAIRAIGLPRERFTADRLLDFVQAYERRTGARAALCDRELAGDYRYSAMDA